MGSDTASAFSRRRFLAGSGSLSVLVGSPLLRAGIPGFVALSASACSARDKAAAFQVFSIAEGREFEAIAERILPATDTPGATDAGVVWFMDQSFGSIMQDRLEFARGGLEEFQSGVASAYPGARLFSDLDENEQDAYLESRQQTDFFGFMRFMTIAGFFGMSTYGGNRDDVGWKLLGLSAGHSGYQPPFGYYDAEYLKEQSDDA